MHVANFLSVCEPNLISHIVFFGVGCSTPEQESEERKCNYERYRGLVQNDFASSEYPLSHLPFSTPQRLLSVLRGCLLCTQAVTLSCALHPLGIFSLLFCPPSLKPLCPSTVSEEQCLYQIYVDELYGGLQRPNEDEKKK